MSYRNEDGVNIRQIGQKTGGSPPEMYDGMLLSAITPPAMMGVEPTQANVAKFGRGPNHYTLGIVPGDADTTSGTITLSYLGQTVAADWDEQASTLQAAFLALTNVDIAEIVGGPLPDIPLLFRLWPTVGNRPATLSITSQSLDWGTAELTEELGYYGTTDVLTVYDPTLSAAAGSYCIYQKIARKTFVPVWNACSGS
jgi:hypothetical protein